jgi:MEDS: MEthanogen/methylotroph, DcmR Sensory domain
MMLSTEISEFLSDFRRTTHAILFYDSQANKQEVLFNHMKYGERGNQGLAYVCSDETPQQVRGDMKKFGIDADGLRSRNRLVINNYDSIYIVDGEVNIPKIGEQFKDLAERYVASGLSGMRASAEMSCFFHHDKVKELLEYEYFMHRRLALPAEGICAYNIRELSERNQLGIIMPLVRAHDPVIMTGPHQSLLLEPEKVEEKQFEETMKVRIPSA